MKHWYWSLRRPRPVPAIGSTHLQSTRFSPSLISQSRSSIESPVLGEILGNVWVEGIKDIAPLGSLKRADASKDTDDPEPAEIHPKDPTRSIQPEQSSQIKPAKSSQPDQTSEISRAKRLQANRSRQGNDPMKACSTAVRPMGIWAGRQVSRAESCKDLAD